MLARIDAAWCKGIRPEPQIPVAAWADRHRMLPDTAAEPGRWCTSRTPYLHEIMDALATASPYERVVMMKGAQVGGSEAGLNWIGYVIHNAPGLMMMVQLTLWNHKVLCCNVLQHDFQRKSPPEGELCI